MSGEFHARHLAALLLILAVAVTLRVAWLRADPPTSSVGIVFHDEGAWTHNARNQALWGTWRTDNWNPVFVAPVFTALEYAAFELVGVGTWQARTVPVAAGLISLVALLAGLRSIGGMKTALIGGALLATNYTWVMWNRAALMESVMTMFVAVAWCAYTLSARRRTWAILAGVSAALAWFTKASAAFFIGAILLDVCWTLLCGRSIRMRSRLGVSAPPDDEIRGAIWTAAALAMTTAVIVVAFVWPHWAEYQFYNWQMSVARKPSYDLRSLIDRASWIPVVQDFFTRMWVELVAAAVAIGGVVVRWRDARPAERLLALWVVVGLAELVAHDSGNERRYVMFIPAVIAMASPVFSGTARTAWTRLKSATRADLLLAAPVLLALAYVVVASALAPFLVVRTAEHPYSDTVRVSAAVGLVLTVALLARWTQVIAWLSDRRVPAWVIAGMVAGILLWNLGLYGRWAVARSELNYEASVKLGALLPPETLVQGKLANGLALENRIRPLFVGRGFGNYEDRFERDDARYILTYGLPREGYESQTGLIREILDRYPNRRLVATFDLDETPALDQAWLIEKTPAGVPAAASGSNRAPD